MSEQNQTVSLTENQIVSKMTNNVGVMRMHKGRVRVEWPNGSVGHWWPGNDGEWCDENLARLRRFYAENIELPENSLMLADGVIVTAVVEGQQVVLHFSNNPGYCVIWKVTQDSSPALDAIKLLALRAITEDALPRLSEGLKNARASLRAKFIEGPPKKREEPKPPEGVDANRGAGRTTEAITALARTGGYYVVDNVTEREELLARRGHPPGVKVICLGEAALIVEGSPDTFVVDHVVYERAAKNPLTRHLLAVLVSSGRLTVPLSGRHIGRPFEDLVKVAA